VSADPVALVRVPCPPKSREAGRRRIVVVLVLVLVLVVVVEALAEARPAAAGRAEYD
jgi:hypothetical protein